MIRIKWNTILFHVLFWIPRIILFIYGFFKQKNDPELFLLNQLGSSVYISRGAGLVLSLDCACLILLTCRNTWTVIRTLLGSIISSQHVSTISSVPTNSKKSSKVVNLCKWLAVSLDNHIMVHRWTAYSILLFTVLHTNAHYFNFYFVEKRLPSLGYSAAGVHYYTFAGITGHIMLIVMYFIYTSSHKSVRKKSFETFWYLHHLFFIFYLALFFHSGGCFVKSAFTGQCKGYNSNWFTIPAFTLYLFERCIRVYRSRLPTKTTHLILHPANTIEIKFEKPSMSYQPGQYIFLCVPSLSRTQWHPFTLSSAPEEGSKSIHIRCSGDWTRQLRKIIQENFIHNPLGLEILVDGPFGAPAQDVYAYPIACLVSTGIGVTPSASILKSMLYRYQRGSPMVLQKLYFIWVNRDAEAFKWFQSLIDTIHQIMGEKRFQIYTYFTGNLSSSEIHNIMEHESKSEWLNSYSLKRSTSPALTSTATLVRSPSSSSSMTPLTLPPPIAFSDTMIRPFQPLGHVSKSISPMSPRSESTLSSHHSSDSRSTHSSSPASTLALDPITGLKTHTFYGRPQWNSLFRTIRDDIESHLWPETRKRSHQRRDHQRHGRKSNNRHDPDRVKVGIFFCGPNPLLREISSQIEEISREDKSSPVVFDVNHEHF